MTAVGVAIGVSAVASASVPSLPHRTVAQLLAEVGQAGARPVGALTATVQETSSLGLPDLPAALEPAGAPGLASGTQSVSIWYRDSKHLRIAEPTQGGESDLRLDGRTLWLWSSKSQTATRLALPSRITGLPDLSAATAAPLLRSQASSAATPGSIPETPIAAANQVLKYVGPSTVVGDQTNVYVAGRAAYQISLVPKSSKSLVGKVLIAVDAARLIPVRVEVFGRVPASLVYSIGFSSLSFGKPAAANFSFTPPRGAKVQRETVPGNLQSALRKAGLSQADISKAGLSKADLSKAGLAAQRARALKLSGKALRGGPVHGGVVADSPLQALAAQLGDPRVIGQDWLSVVATPANPTVAAVVSGLLQEHASPGASSVTSYSGSAAYSSTPTIRFTGPGPGLAEVQTLLKAATPVHGSWGSGRLLRTNLLSVLVTSKGQILAGAVSPAVLYADVALDVK